MHEARAHDPRHSSVGGQEPLGRRGFFRRVGRAGALGLAVAAVGDLLAAPVAGARQTHLPNGLRGFVVDGKNGPDECTGYAYCSRCNLCCPGGACPPSYYCYHCVSDNCGSSYYTCYSGEPDKFTICCH